MLCYVKYNGNNINVLTVYLALPAWAAARPSLAGSRHGYYEDELNLSTLCTVLSEGKIHSDYLSRTGMIQVYSGNCGACQRSDQQATVFKYTGRRSRV